MRALALLLALAATAPAQHYQPWNVEVLGGKAHPYSFYGQHFMVVEWNPATTPHPLRLHPNQPWTEVKLTVREIVAFHPPYWTGQWYGFELGLRLVRTNLGFTNVFGVYPWRGLGYEYVRGLNIPLPWPGDFGLDYGTWVGTPYGYTPVPTYCAMLVEVTL